MRFLIINADYPAFLGWLYAQHPSLKNALYEEQMRIRNESLFGVADFYSSNLKKLGHEAYDVHVNNEFMQNAWAREHGIRLEKPSRVLQGLRKAIGPIRRIATLMPSHYIRYLFQGMFMIRPLYNYDVLSAQIKYYKPDILLNNVMSISSQFLREMKPYIRLLVGQHAATHLSDDKDFSVYDLVISSFPPTLEWFREKGIPTQLHRLGFDARILNYINSGERIFDVTFIGSFYNVHSSRIAWLESLSTRFPQIKIWGPRPPSLLLKRQYMGQAWGHQMYQILRSSKITLNHHGDVPPYANNMRLFEATGMGTLLITDWKENLHEIFEPGKEVIAYRNTRECAELIQYYLEHDEDRKAIACAGQQRVLREHTYYYRMQELVEIVRNYL